MKIGSIFRTLAVAALFVCGIPVHAQFRAGIQGTVLDASGAAVPGASVTLTNNETQKKQTTTASGEGFYRFGGLAPGKYTISATGKGFKGGTVENINLGA